MPRVSDVSDDAPDSPAAPSPGQAFHQASLHARELASFVEYYISARLDALRGSIRRMVLYAILGLVAVVAAVTLVVMAVALTVLGLADLVNWALSLAWNGLSPWVGPLIVGVGLLTLLAAGGMAVAAWQFRAWRRQLVKKYEHKRRKQKQQFGRDVSEAADTRQ